MSEASPLDDVRDTLYGGPRTTFLERRKELAGAARRGGDREQAKLIDQLRKPAAAAHVVNLLARSGDGSLHDLLELGASIRDAMSEGDDRTLRSLLQGRSDAIAKAAARAREVARANGESVSGTVGDQIVQTLRAAMASDDAADAVRRGTLADVLDEPGFDGFSITAAARAPALTSPGRGRKQRKRDVPVVEDDQRAAERAASEARITSAAAALQRIEEEVAVATKCRDSLAHDRHRVSLQLARIDGELGAAQADLDEIEARRSDARAEIDAAREAAPD